MILFLQHEIIFGSLYILWEDIAIYRCKSSANILTIGKKILEKNIRVKDALHIASAIESKCEYFITTDYGLLNKDFEEIKIINPIDFVRNMEE